MTTLRHNYLPDLQEQFSYDDKVTFWIDKETGDMHIRTDKGEEVIPPPYRDQDLGSAGEATGGLSGIEAHFLDEKMVVIFVFNFKSINLVIWKHCR